MEKEKYIPPYSITDEMLYLVIDITNGINKLKISDNFSLTPKIRQVNRIKSIQGSLAIEQNALGIDEVTALINGKPVIGPLDDIKAVQNAIKVYDMIDSFDPYSIDDLLKAHSIMMDSLIDEAGHFRSSNVGVFSEGGTVSHVAPPHDLVFSLIDDLFSWLIESDTHPLIKSCVFHYEFEFIHPFMDGNGRTGRLWQTLILSKWNPLFKWLPIENIILQKRGDYYKAISDSTLEGNSNPFIIFMLQVIKETLEASSASISKEIELTNSRLTKLMSVMEESPLSLVELMNRLHLKNRDSFRKNYINPALEAGLIKMTSPAHPQSKSQKYYKI